MSDALCKSFQTPNYLAWAAAGRGLLESAGDTWDGLGNVAVIMAQNHAAIKYCLTGKATNGVYDFSELETKLDHFVLARWMRPTKEAAAVQKAKDNVEYVRHLDEIIPKVETLYHTLCSIVHPAAPSIEWLYGPIQEEGMRIVIDDRKAIADILSRWPNSMQEAMMIACNTPLLILRVLHKFGVHRSLTF